MNTPLIATFIAFDVTVTSIVLAMILRKRGGLPGLLGFDPQKVVVVSRQMEQECEEYVRANWSGDPATLPSVLEVLLGRFETRMNEQGLTLDREHIKPLLVRVLEVRKLAQSHDVREAMKQVA